MAKPPILSQLTAPHALLIALFATCLIGGVFLIPACNGKEPEWVGAIGAVAAFAGTIWIAGTESRRRRHEEHQLALIICLELSADIAWLRQHLSVFDALPTQLSNHDREVWPKIADSISSRAQWPDEQLAKLIGAGGHIAKNAAVSKALIRTAVNLMKTYASSFENPRGLAVRDECLAAFKEARKTLDACAYTMGHFVTNGVGEMPDPSARST